MRRDDHHLDIGTDHHFVFVDDNLGTDHHFDVGTNDDHRRRVDHHILLDDRHGARHHYHTTANKHHQAQNHDHDHGLGDRGCPAVDHYFDRPDATNDHHMVCG